MKKQYKIILEKKLTSMLIFMVKEDNINKNMYLDIKKEFSFSNKSIFKLEEELKKINLFSRDDDNSWEELSIFKQKIKLNLFKHKKEILFSHLREILLYCILFRNKEEGEQFLLENELFFSKKKDTLEKKEIQKLIPGIGDNIGNLIEDLSEEIIPKLSKMDLSSVDITNPMTILSDHRFKNILEETGVKLKEKMRKGDINEDELKTEIVNFMPNGMLNNLFSNITKK